MGVQDVDPVRVKPGDKLGHRGGFAGRGRDPAGDVAVVKKIAAVTRLQIEDMVRKPVGVEMPDKGMCHPRHATTAGAVQHMGNARHDSRSRIAAIFPAASGVGRWA